MIIDNAIPINIKKRLIITYFTKADEEARGMLALTPGYNPENREKELEFIKKFDIARPNVIYDKELLTLKVSGELQQDLSIGVKKRQIILDMTCNYYVPEESTTLAIMIPIPKYDDYGVYFFGWCNSDKSKPHVKKYNNPVNQAAMDANRDKEEKLLIFPKMIFGNDKSTTPQMSNSESSDISGYVAPVKPVINTGVKEGSGMPAIIHSGMLDIEFDVPAPPIIRKSDVSQSSANGYFSNIPFLGTFWALFKTLFICTALVAVVYGIWTGITNPKKLKSIIKGLKAKAWPEEKYSNIANQDYTDGDCGDELEEDSAGGGMFEVPDNKNYRDV